MPEGFLEIGDQVEEFDVRLGFERLFQRREIDPVLFQRHADQPRAEGFDGIVAPTKLGDSHSTTSPGLHSTLATSSMACWAPLVIRSSSNARPIPCFCFRYALRRSRSGRSLRCAVLERIDGPGPGKSGMKCPR